VVNARKVNAVHRPVLVGYPDFLWFICDDTEATAALVSDIVPRRIPAWFGLAPWQRGGAETCEACRRRRARQKIETWSGPFWGSLV